MSLRSRAGSILDAQNDRAADVIGQTIDIDAHGGSIGQCANDLEIDSSLDSFFPGFDAWGSSITQGRGSLVEALLDWQWPDGGWNCDRHRDAWR